MWYVFFTAVVSFRRIVFGESILSNRLRHRRSTFNYDWDTLVDSDARVYYKDGDLYGKTKRGKFVLEDDAKKEGVFEAKLTPNRQSKKRPDQSGIDDSIETHSSTAPKQ